MDGMVRNGMDGVGWAEAVGCGQVTTTGLVVSLLPAFRLSGLMYRVIPTLLPRESR